MVFNEYKTPYPYPYKDKNLMTKDIITGTITKALFLTLLNGGLQARYGDYFEPTKFINNATSTSIQRRVLNDDGIAINMPQIKQVAWLPYYIEVSSYNKKTFYEPYTKYSQIKYIQEPIVEANGGETVIKGFAYYYNPVGYFYILNGKLYLLDIQNKKSIELYTIKDTSNFKIEAVAKGIVAVTDNDKFILISLKNNETLEVNKQHYIYSTGWLGYIIVDRDIYNSDLEKIGTIQDLLLPNNMDLLTSGQNENGQGIYVDGVYYFLRDDKTSYALIIKKDKQGRYHIKEKIVKSKLGMFSCYLKYGFGMSNNHIIDNVPFKIYFYNYIKFNEFFVDKLSPLKYNQLKKTSGEWTFLSAYGDLLYNINTGKIYHSMFLGQWYERTDMEDKYDRLTDGNRIWFNRDYKYAGFFGYLKIIDYNNKKYLGLDGFAFY